jgi:SAM-dependent methyltransferase
MSMFRDGWFHCVLSNATLEHDPFFWKTCAEIRRVLRHGGLAIIGVPGFSPEADVDVLGLPDPWCGEVAETHRQWEECTLTFKFHGFPHDYYRFSEAAVREGIFEGYRDVTVKAVMVPPRFVAHGYKSEESSQRQPKQGRNWIRPIAILQKRLFDSGKQ